MRENLARNFTARARDFESEVAALIYKDLTPPPLLIFALMRVAAT
jgi:hypothetical protein